MYVAAAAEKNETQLYWEKENSVEKERGIAFLVLITQILSLVPYINSFTCYQQQ